MEINTIPLASRVCSGSGVKTLTRSPNGAATMDTGEVGRFPNTEYLSHQNHHRTPSGSRGSA